MKSSTPRRALGLVAASAFLLLAGGAALVPAAPAIGADTTMSREDVYKDVQATFGAVPAFVKQLPTAILRDSWQEEKDLELSDKTALPPKVKALISLAVAAQIPCSYCIWSDTATARQLGATDEEIGEAVAVAALTRQSSTLLNGLQVDLEQFKKDMGSQTAAK